MSVDVKVDEGLGKQINAFFRQLVQSPMMLPMLILLGVSVSLLLINHSDRRRHEEKEILLMKGKDALEMEYRASLRAKDSFYNSLYFENMRIGEKYREAIDALAECQHQANYSTPPSVKSGKR